MLFVHGVRKVRLVQVVVASIEQSEPAGSTLVASLFEVLLLRGIISIHTLNPQAIIFSNTVIWKSTIKEATKLL